MRRLWKIFMVCGMLGLLMAFVSATEVEASETLVDTMDGFREEYGLDEDNFSIAYYNTVTGESYNWNDGKYMIAASTFKLPLNLHYYEMERAGTIKSDAYISGTPLSTCHYQSLVHSNNEMSINMLYNLGNFRTYKDTMLNYFAVDKTTLDNLYYVDNYYTTEMMMDCLQYLYQREGDFPQMIEYMKEAQPDAYFRAKVTEYDVAHKYGYIIDDNVLTVNDVGIIYAPQPFLLAVYTTGAPYPENVVAEACRVLTDYTVETYEQGVIAEQLKAEELRVEAERLAAEEAKRLAALEAKRTAVEEAQAQKDLVALGEEQGLPEPTPVSPEQEGDAGVVWESLWWMIPVALVVFGLGGFGLLFITRTKKQETFYERWEKNKKE